MGESYAQIQEQDIRIPTYHIREDPNPPLFSPLTPWVYPYPKQDEILRPRDEGQLYRAVVMENPYLKVTVLPQLGGRLYSAYDKTANREIFHKVDVIKPALIGLRGAWICGGIEFNFIRGHHVMTVSPVDHLIHRNPDGSVSVTVGHMERRSRARWNVTLTLRPDRSYLQVDLKLYNRYRYRLDFYQWSNSSVVAREDLFYPYPTEYVISSGRRLYRFPIQGGLDISRWTSIPVAHDLFAIGTDADFMGIYYEEADVGMVHYADHHQAPGKKLFTWGTDDAGRIWDYILTDGDVPYVEPQAGNVVDQRTFRFLQPHQVVQWREYWWGIHGMKGFVQVNEEAALNFAPFGEDKTLIAVNTTRAIRGAHVCLLVNGEVAYEERFEISPNAPYAREIDLPPVSWQEADTRLVLSDEEGRELIRYHKPRPNLWTKVELPRPFEPQVNARSSAEELIIAGREAEKLRRYEEAEKLYRKALSLDPGHAEAHTNLGALYNRRGLYREAYRELTTALSRDPDHGRAHYHLGIACRELGDLKAARDHFWALQLDPAYNSQGFYYLGEMALAEGDMESAVELFQRSLDLNRLHVKGHDMLAMALRKMGQAQEARAVLEKLLQELDPTDVLAQAELWLLSPSSAQQETLLSRIGGDVQVLLELACDYMGVAQWEDAVQILRLWPGVAQEEAAHPMIYYYLAYCHDKLGEMGKARHLYGLASEMDPTYVFPHRLEELTVLARALEVNPADARAHAYRGMLLYALLRKEEALESWQRSLTLEPNAVVYRNMGKALWKDKGDLAAAERAYRKAISLSPDDHRLYADLYDVLVAMGTSAQERVALLEKAPQHCRIQARLAAALVELEEWDRAIEVLGVMQFDPYEGERSTRPTYYAAYIGRGLKRYREGKLKDALQDFEAALEYPRNVGVGKSYFAQDSKAFYWAGVVAEELGEHDKARRYWEEGAAIRPRPQEGPASPLGGYESEARYYKSLCLQKLGRADEAAQLF
jgi:tetratricopeptide (TPR) repeat protein